MSEASARLFRSLDRELWVVTAQAEGHAGGLIATSVSQASIDDSRPRLLLGIARQHSTSPLILKSGAFVAHLISSQQTEWVKHFGAQSGREIPKLQSFETFTSETEAPILSAAHAWLECRIETSMESGDRDWILAEVVDAKWTDGFKPLTLHQFLVVADDQLKGVLKKQLHEDSLTDADLVDAWRRTRESQ